jgi:hypothetical protein
VGGAAAASICLHTLRDFTRIGEICGEVRRRLKPRGVFLNLDLINAPDRTGPSPPGLDQQINTESRIGSLETEVLMVLQWKK